MYTVRWTGIIERMIGGASIINVEKVENLPGFPEGIMGPTSLRRHRNRR